MRLIFGALHLDGTRASDRLLRAMAEQLDVPRLRPSWRTWLYGPIGLGVLDFSGGGTAATELPHTAASTLAADVRLDEADSLRRALGADAPQAEDALLLATLEKFGPARLDRVLGDFAFAHWNAETQRLTCGRDAVGIRPLAYVHQPGRLFAFGSFPIALHGSGIVAKQIDEGALARRVTHSYRFDDSLVMGIKRLPPAHVIEVSNSGVALKRYWQLDRTAVGTRRCPPDRAALVLREALDQAVGCRLARTGETGAHLSGGLDSSSIAVLAARRLRGAGRRLHAYSFLDRQRSDFTFEDETEFVKAVLQQEGDIDWTPIPPPAALAAHSGPMDVDKMWPLHAEEPDNAVCARAETQGVSLILSGWGGDEGATFNGRGSLAELFLRGRWWTLARQIAALRRERGWRISRIFYNEIVSYVVPSAALNLAKRLLGKGEGLPDSFAVLLSAGAQRRVGGSVGQHALNLAPDGRENRWRLMNSPHIAERAALWAQIGARHGVAFAFPLLDRRVVELALSLPSDIFLRDGFRRRLFRDAMADVLPARVRLRHEKYRPFPSYLLELAESRMQFLARVDAYERNETISRLLDLARLRRLIEGFPSPDDARASVRHHTNPRASASIIGVVEALRIAAYIEQHSGEQPFREQPIGQALLSEQHGGEARSMSVPHR